MAQVVEGVFLHIAYVRCAGRGAAAGKKCTQKNTEKYFKYTSYTITRPNEPLLCIPSYGSKQY